MKKTMLKKFVVLVMAVLMLLALVSCKKKEKGVKTTISIDVSKIFDHSADLNEEKKDFVPADGKILDTTEVYVEKGTNALDQLKKACESNEIDYEVKDSDYGAYVEGLGQIYTGDCGAFSGWMFKLNGEWSDFGAGSVELNENDSIEWIFICDYSTDV